MADFILDTFTGTGTLATHVGETGAVWNAVSGTLAQWGLSGGVITPNVLFTPMQLAASALPPEGVAIGYEIDVVINTFPWDFTPSVGFFVGDATATDGLILQLTDPVSFPSGNAVLTVYAYTSAGNDEWPIVLGSPYSNGQILQLRAEINATRTGIKVFVGGALLLDEALPGALPAIVTQGPFFNVSPAGSATGVSYSRFSAETLGPPPPTPAFWSNFVLTHEVP